MLSLKIKAIMAALAKLWNEPQHTFVVQFRRDDDSVWHDYTHRNGRPITFEDKRIATSAMRYWARDEASPFMRYRVCQKS